MAKKLTTEEFIAKANITHNGKYGYDRTIYINARAKVTVTCYEHGDFEQQAGIHIHSQGCPKCGLIKQGRSLENDTKSFIAKASEVHNGKYRYTKTDYKHSKGEVIVTCLDHGDFTQVATVHLQGYGCSKCSGRERYTTELFIERANEKHKGKYDYSKTNIVNSRTKVIITCKDHGDFLQRPDQHLEGDGCSACSGCKQHTTESFIEKSRLLHGDTYGYSKSDYKAGSSKIIITCKYHGDFSMRAYCHMNEGQGCPKCGKLVNGWSRSAFKERCDNKNNGLGILYIIKCFNEEEEFYKIGIASNSIKDRYKSSMPYDYEVIHELHREPNKVYDMENDILRGLAKYSYKPLIPFSGQTECIDSLEPLYKLFKQYIR